MLRALGRTHVLVVDRTPDDGHPAMLLDPDPADWLMVHRTYDFQCFSPLDQIDRDNVGQLRLAWMRAMDEGPQEIRPLVYDGVMYIAHVGDDARQVACSRGTSNTLFVPDCTA